MVMSRNKRKLGTNMKPRQTVKEKRENKTNKMAK